MPSPRAVIPDRFNALTDAELQSLIGETRGMRHLADLLKMRNAHYGLLKARLEQGEFNLSGWAAKRLASTRRASLKGVPRAAQICRDNARARFEAEVLPFLFVENSKFSGKDARRYIRTWNSHYGWLEYKCQVLECGNLGFHAGKVLTLQLDHVNGQAGDHRLNNLRYLCPNCHAQTETYTGGNTASARRKRAHE